MVKDYDQINKNKMSWRTAVVNCQPHLSPKDYDPKLFKMRVRFAQQDEIDIDHYAKKYVGGPGVIWIKTTSYAMKKYDIGEWLKPENYSSAMFTREVNKCIQDYFKHNVKWDDSKIYDYAPFFFLEKNVYRWNNFEMDRYHLKLHCRRVIDEMEYKALNLQFIVDANLAFALNALGFSFNSSCGHSNRNHSWWEVRPGYIKPTGVLDIPLTFTWSYLRKIATYPINNICTQSWMWDVFYSFDDEFTADDRLSSILPDGLSKEEQLLGIIKKTLFRPWKQLGYIKKYELTFKPNKFKPSIRQMHIHIIAQDYWYRLNFTFSPMVIELFNWNRDFLENGNTIVIDHDHRDFIIDMSKYSPPERDALNNDFLIQAKTNFYEVIHSSINPEQVAMKVALPTLDSSKPRFLEFSYKADSSEGYIVSNQKYVCASKLSSYCSTPKLDFKLTGGLKRAYNLRSANLRIQAHILNRYGISLTSTEKVYASKHAHEKIIKRMKLKLGDYTILSTQHYHEMLSMLNLLYKSKGISSPIEREAYFESKTFDLKVDLFQFDEAPPYFLIPKEDVVVEVEINNTAYYVERVDGSGTTEYNLRIQDSNIALESAPLNDHIWKSMDYAWRRHAPFYTYIRRKVQFAYVRAGNMRFEETLFVKNPNAQRFFIGASTATKRNAQIQFNHCNIISMRLSQGENEVIGEAYLLNYNHNDQTFHIPYVNFVKARSKELSEMTMEEYCNGNILFTFNNHHSKTPSTEPIKLEIIFKEAVKENIYIYCMSETEETIEMGSDGRLRETNRKSPSSFSRGKRSITQIQGNDYTTPSDPQRRSQNNDALDAYGNPLVFGVPPDLKPKFLTDLESANNLSKGVSADQRPTALKNISKLRPTKTLHEGEKVVDHYPFIRYDKSKFL